MANENPKVAFICSKFPCYDEAFILREIYALAKRMDILIFSLKNSREKIVHDQAKELTSRTIYIPFFFSWKILLAHVQFVFTKPARYLSALARLIAGNLSSPEFLFKGLAFFPKAVYLAARLEKEKVTHLHAYWATYPASVALVVSELTGIPFSFTGHAHDIYLDTTHLREKIRRATFVSTCTRSNRDYLEKIARQTSPNKILVNYHGLDLAQFAVNGKTRNQVFQILSVGTLHYYKGFNYLLHALEILGQKGLRFHCTIIGGGPLEQDLRRHIQLLHLETHVTMTGPLKQNEVLPYYKKADVLVLMAQPEWHWGIPNVLIESLAAKTPVITTRFGSVEELVKDGETGLLVSPKDFQGLADALERLYNNDSLRMQLAEAGNRFVNLHFDLGKNIQQFAERFSYEKSPALVA